MSGPVWGEVGGVLDSILVDNVEPEKGSVDETVPILEDACVWGNGVASCMGCVCMFTGSGVLVLVKVFVPALFSSTESGPLIDCTLEQDRKGRAASNNRSGYGEGVAVLVYDVLEYRCSISWNSLFGCAILPVSPDPDLGIGNLSRCGRRGGALPLQTCQNFYRDDWSKEEDDLVLVDVTWRHSLREPRTTNGSTVGRRGIRATYAGRGRRRGGSGIAREKSMLVGWLLAFVKTIELGSLPGPRLEGKRSRAGVNNPSLSLAGPSLDAGTFLDFKDDRLIVSPWGGVFAKGV